ncbi:cation-translocating P-type ATPase ['Camptotheca acuminata' phytoplasma]|uniref:cation-translocating P-type ATPase n=1 Tax='Camptotheca acuminata' phytoplasma TaxID=3239192 RepID=UPI00351A259F
MWDDLFPQDSLKILEKQLNTNFIEGLNKKQIEQNFLKYGSNKLKEIPKKNFFHKLIHQFNNIFIYILFSISLLTFLIGIIENQKEELFESILILTIILINSFLGVFFENKKENSLSLIQNKTKPYVKVLRNKELQFILKENLVIGDIIILEAGDVVAADLRLIETNNFTVNEAILTGELSPVAKNEHIIQNKFVLYDSPNLIFMETNVISGKARGVVIQIGENTQIGKITNSITKEKKNKTPLEKNINQLSKLLGLIIIIIISLNFCLTLLKYHLSKEVINLSQIQKLLISSVILAVAVIPESILAIINIILASGVKKIIKKKAIIKNLSTLETLGAVNIICTDKTGTLTHNKMTIKKIYSNNKITNIDETDIIPDLDIQKLIRYGVLCNNNYSSENLKYQKKENFLFDPIDQSFINLAHLWKLNIKEIQNKNKKIKEFPFDNNYKFMITIHQKDQERYLIIKGAYEIILNLSNYIQYKNEFVRKNKDNCLEIEKNLNSISSEGYKVIGIAYCRLNDNNFNFDILNPKEELLRIKDKITFLGAFGIEDPIRSEILPTIQECQKAFIDLIMITGDHIQTAIKVASDLKIFDPSKDLALTGEQLDLLSENEFQSKLSSIKVYARVTPEHKLKIIKSWQKQEKIVAMIGDGVNDALSIKKADIGISMGKTGTDITKQTSDIILTEDNFTTIKNIIHEGRNIFENIKKSITFLLSCNIGEIIVILLNTCLGYFLFNKNFVILSTLQILWVNLVTDSLVAISLGMEYPEKNLMQQKPRIIKNSLLNKKTILKIISEGFMIGLLTFLAGFIGYKLNNNNNQYGQTISFMVLSFSQLIHVFNFRSYTKSIFKLKINFYLIISFIISFLLQISIFIIPFLRNFFQLVPSLSYLDIMIIVFFSLCLLIIGEFIKKIKIFFENKKMKI